ncbi:MAG: UDP-N-acetylmuramoyl-L-alanyl-D-glutamate--2,6-diaminopimelate ligase [Myxococcales bacterium]
MKLDDLFAGADVRVPAGCGAADVRALAVDSREAGPGALFAALPGTRADGAQFAAEAVQRGAVAVLAGRPLGREVLGDVPCLVATDPRRAFARAAARFHGDPSTRLQLLGVTGTNGKTTTTYLVEQMAAELGLRAGLAGTVEQRFPGHAQAATHTTPESHTLQELLARMVAARVSVAAIEVSSHALAQERVAGCVFAGAAFTNLTRDHLDYHGTLDAYFAQKARLFRELLPAGTAAVLNLDDARIAGLAAELRREGRVRVFGFTLRAAAGAELAASRLSTSLAGLAFDLRTPWGSARVESPLLGAHNAENLLAALGLLAGTGTPLSGLVRAVVAAAGAPGRLERVADAAGRIVLVDYAHTDDALARVLDALRAAAAGARLVCVFGCGGDRDAGKRPLMGRAAGERADLVVATSDNPRTEDPGAILAQIEPGLAQAKSARLGPAQALALHRGYCVEPDRRSAIALAVACARKGDAVLIAGKGHEPWQIVGAEKRPFDDRREAGRALARVPPAPERSPAP